MTFLLFLKKKKKQEHFYWQEISLYYLNFSSPLEQVSPVQFNSNHHCPSTG